MAIQFDQYTEFVTEGPVIHRITLAGQSLDVLLTLNALHAGYQHCTALGRPQTLNAGELVAVQSAAGAVYADDVIENEIDTTNPITITGNLATVRSYPEHGPGLVCVAGVTTVFYAGTLWGCRVNHTVTNDPNWRPGVAPNLWQKFYSPANPAWSYPTAYKGDNTQGAGKGDVVTHNNRRWRCGQTHTSNSAWYPGAPGVYLWIDMGLI